MRRELSYLKDSQYSCGFRTVKGHDDEVYLNKDGLKDIPNVPGIYIIVAADKTKFIYPKGTSSVIYIGKADNLQRRLCEHLRELKCLEENEEEWLSDFKEASSRYYYIKEFGGKVYTFHCLGKQDAKNLEADILWRFYEKYRSLPVGN